MSEYQTPQALTDNLHEASVPYEQSIIAALVNSPKAARVLDMLEPSDFRDIGFSAAFVAAREIAERGTDINRVTLQLQLEVANSLDKLKIIDERGSKHFGAEGIAMLPASSPRGAELDSTVQAVLKYSKLRKLVQLANDVAKRAYSAEDAGRVVGYIDETLSKMRSSYEFSAKNAPRSFHDIAITASEEIENAAKSNSYTATGLTDVDALLGGGGYRGEMIIVAARPGMGKSSFLGTVAQNMARAGKRVGILTLEMSAETYFNRMAAARCGIPYDILRSGRMTPEQLTAYYESLSDLADLEILVDDTSSLTPSAMRRKVLEMRKQFGKLDAVMLDYIGLMSGRGENANAQVTEISRAIKILAREVDAPIFAAAQLNRAVELRSSAEPQLSDLRDSGSLEQDSDVVVFLYREKPDDTVTKFKVAKNRSGKTGITQLFFDMPHTKFANAARSLNALTGIL